MKNEAILILDFGSQYTQLIARRVRELHVYCEIRPYNTPLNEAELSRFKGVILSGSPCSVRQNEPPKTNLDIIRGRLPILGICYGAQLLAQEYGGKVEPCAIREYGRANLTAIQPSALLNGLDSDTQIWMSHGDSISELPKGAVVLAQTSSIPVAAFGFEGEQTYGIQFHPEVTHTSQGKELLSNFIITICACQPSWTPAAFVTQTIESLKTQLPDGNVVLGLSGGVDSSVAALLLHQAIGKRLFCIFVDSGLLRKDEFEQVIGSYHSLGLQVKGVQAKAEFFDALKGISDPEAKRKAIGRVFIEVFEHEANQIPDVNYLAQGTIYPDVIESVSVNGPSVMIKSHHNVGGLPDRMKLKIVEPLRMLFKDEVRRAGRELQLPEAILNRHPFPGPGLAIRILGEITSEKVTMLQHADHIFISLLKAHGLYDKVWQAGVILLPVYSVGVMGDERTYEQVVALRAVSSSDGMSADWVHLPYEFLALVSNQIINSVKGINRVVYDISSKPPATIEWE